MIKKLIVTGGAGFVGSHVVRLFINKYGEYRIINVDVLTYTGYLENLSDIESAPNYEFERVDIVDAAAVDALFDKCQPEGVIRLASESQVDRSIKDPLAFVRTNILGMVNLLNSFKRIHEDFQGKRFYHIRTDEVYGTLGKEGLFEETTPYDRNSPYSASKASSEYFVRDYCETYGIPYVVTNFSNNYFQNQFLEKLIPLFINNIVEEKPLPVYGDGQYTRDWLYVVDHARVIDLVCHEGENSETYKIGQFNEWTNIDLIKVLCAQIDEKLGREKRNQRNAHYLRERPSRSRPQVCH